MTKKELKNIAKKIAQNELILETSEDNEAISQAQRNIMSLAHSITKLEDITYVDELVQEILSKILTE